MSFMTLKELQEEIVKTRSLFEERYKMKATGKYASLKAAEELGEFIKVMLVYEDEVTDLKKNKYKDIDIKREMGKELADVVAWLMILADIYEIDLEKELRQKWCGIKKAF
jgi:NTP pyrophosphatase (non-canonical NTP hydrolase)